MLEAQQKRLNGGALDRTIDINADAPSLQFRRQLDRLIEAETVAPIGLAVRSG
jgi:hypothetical protein